MWSRAHARLLFARGSTLQRHPRVAWIYQGVAHRDSVDPRHARMLRHQYVAHCRQRTGSSTPGRALSWMRTLRRAG